MWRHLWFYLTFLIAVLALSRLIGAVEEALARGTVQAWARAAIVVAALFVSFLYLGFTLYEVDRRAGRVRRPLRLYEWWIRARGTQR
ncbi:MAG: hypothetical protein QN198_04490 [Armatimonadota bacterium]|nr:hypothetical protein [Armatimonadota bacterium]MDR5702842.1 hypothetical protein [Armatimonadota bacterium]MDR7435066.1 hypothetical protein [Armatimonadota bacterium]